MLWLIKHQILPQDLPAGKRQSQQQQQQSPFPAFPAPVWPEQPPTGVSLPRVIVTGIPRTSQLDEASPQQMDTETAAAALWPLPHLCHHKDTKSQQRNDFSNQREQLLLNQSCRKCLNRPRNSQQGIPLNKQDSQGP